MIPSLTYDAASDKAREECGVFAVRDVDDASVLVALGLHALQHRGQEACGITSYDGLGFHSERRLGLVGDNFTDPETLAGLKGRMAIGHNRYSTSGSGALRNVQPLYADVRGGGVAVAHNGNLTNARALREELVASGAIFQSTSDTEVIIQLAARSRKTNSAERLLQALRQIEGAFALVALTNDKLIGARDPLGIRPLVMGQLDDGVIFASETCALDMIGARFIREVEPGEAVIVSDNGIESRRYAPAEPARTCAFEYIYFARPDSVISGRSVYEARKRMGIRLAQECPADIDVVVPVPDSGMTSALGYATEIGKPFDLGIIRSHFVGRTFIQPTQAKRDLSVRRKHSANAAALKGKRVLLVDDSIVRGTTSKKIVRMVREAGAKEVHFRSACPAITHPDFYGIDMPMREELMAASHDSERMREMLDCDSLGFLSVDGLYWAVCQEARNDAAPQLADHYFTGEYPTRLIDRDRAIAAKEQQLSFLVDA
ncbi:amidophosphoribosyltransferase [Marinicauda sp. Alg238-R41]|uniref:amidophosphoribosyltransferase n=1 Tax=Marinicauda sp. Alg238-R41 TaxID=2993447 RepID=UPI0022DED3B2|nr:amidophosphoribosyltransferase [Marinicauda sp. Alg238-R41]